jgi:hypothetical protein
VAYLGNLPEPFLEVVLADVDGVDLELFLPVPSTTYVEEVLVQVVGHKQEPAIDADAFFPYI